MQAVLQKLVCFTISSSSFLLSFLQFVSSSSQEIETQNRHISSKDSTIPKLITHKLSSEIALHGVLLWASMGFLVPVGILTIRMSNRMECGRRRKDIIVCIHAGLQMLSVLLVTAGAIMSIKSFENSFENTHQRIGLTLYGAIWLQALTGFLRPHRGSRGRSVWFSVHWVLGIAVSTMGIINVYTGLQAYHKRTSRSTRLWTALFTAEISFIAFFYLLQEKWDYIQQQGVILGNEPVRPTDQEISPTETPKDVSLIGSR